MKIALASDVHFEFHKNQPDWVPEIARGCDVIVLAGDISVGSKTLEAVERINRAHPESTIVWVAGNHEFYRCDVDSQINKFVEANMSCDRMHYLENSKVEIKGMTFLGCTLWTGFDGLGEADLPYAMRATQEAISDFTLIQNGIAQAPFTPEDATERYWKSRAWLKRELSQLDATRTVVVTHFPPCREARNVYFEESLLSAYFQANCRDLIEKYQPAVWCYGHNHYSDGFRIGKTQVISNQLGYPGERFDTRYDPDKIIELPS